MEKFVPAPPTKYKATWCGPYSLAIINGMSCDDAIIGVKSALRRNRQVKGMYPNELLRICGGKYFKRKVEKQKLKGKLPTLRNLWDWLKPNRLYIVHVTSHFVVLDTSDKTICDTASKSWVSLDGHKYAGRRVITVMEVKK